MVSRNVLNDKEYNGLRLGALKGLSVGIFANHPLRGARERAGGDGYPNGGAAGGRLWPERCTRINAEGAGI